MAARESAAPPAGSPDWGSVPRRAELISLGGRMGEAPAG